MHPRLPAQLAGLRIQRIGVGAEVAEQKRFGPAVLVEIEYGRGAHLSVRLEAPKRAAVLSVERIDHALLAADEYGFGCHQRLRARARRAGKGEAPLQFEAAHVIAIQDLLVRLIARVVEASAPAVPDWRLTEWRIARAAWRAGEGGSRRL